MVIMEEIIMLVTAMLIDLIMITAEVQRTLQCPEEITLHAILTKVLVKEIQAEQLHPAVQ
jgi:hypothetical protein